MAEPEKKDAPAEESPPVLFTRGEKTGAAVLVAVGFLFILVGVDILLDGKRSGGMR